MADIWISRRRWTCKYCNVTVNDDVPSRRHHENGARHKQNVERSLKELYRESHIRRATSGAPAPRVSRDSAARGSNTYENYSTAASLGYSAADDKEWRERLANRKGEATVGEWQTVVPGTHTSGPAKPAEHAEATAPGHESLPPMTDREEARRFELVERTLDASDEDDDLPIKTTNVPAQLSDRSTDTKRVESSSTAKREAREPSDDADGHTPQEANPFRKRRARGGAKKVAGDAFA